MEKPAEQSLATIPGFPKWDADPLPGSLQLHRDLGMCGPVAAGRVEPFGETWVQTLLDHAGNDCSG